MPISWNEIRHNAIKFSREWAGVKSETAEKQTFWNEFFQVFGIKRWVVASFEEGVKRISGDYGRIDLFWPGILLVEHKSFGEDLHKAETQAFQYIRDLANDPPRRDEIPRYIIVSDFARIALHDLEPEDQRDLPLLDQKRGVTHVFPLAEFHHHVHHFAFIPGYKQHTLQEQDPVNIEAVAITLADLYDPLAMPPELLKAHTELDRAVEKCYRPEPFHSDRERVEFLFALYEKLTAPLLPGSPNPDKLDEILARHGLLAKWRQFKDNYASE